MMPPWLLSRGLIAADAPRVDILLLIMWPAGGHAGRRRDCRCCCFACVASSSGRFKAGSMRRVRRSAAAVGLGRRAGRDRLPIAVQPLFFGTPVWHSVLAIPLSVPLGLVALRVLGETNWGPISTMTNVMQAVFGVIAPGDLRANMVSSGITGAVAAESEGLMQDFRAGQMIGSTPRMLTYMQLIAVPVGALALAFMYPLLRDTYGVIGENAQLLSPTSQRWVGFAKLVTQDSRARQRPIRTAAARIAWMTTSLGVGALIGVLLTLLEQNARWRPYVPSPDGNGHRDAHSGQRGHDDLPRCRGRLDLGEDLARIARAILDPDRVRPDRRRSAGRRDDPAARDGRADEPAVALSSAKLCRCRAASDHYDKLPLHKLSECQHATLNTSYFCTVSSI